MRDEDICLTDIKPGKLRLRDELLGIRDERKGMRDES
jgi:hypothetical protein